MKILIQVYTEEIQVSTECGAGELGAIWVSVTRGIGNKPGDASHGGCSVVDRTAQRNVHGPSTHGENNVNKNTCIKEFLLWLSRLKPDIVSMRMWVPSLASLSGLGIQILCCHGCGVGWQRKL